MRHHASGVSSSLSKTPGYQKLHQNITQGKADHHEGLDLYAPSPYPAPAPSGTLRPLVGPNQWPERRARLKEVVERWVEKMKGLGMAVMRGMADGLGMREEEWVRLRRLVDDSFWVMRLIGGSELTFSPSMATVLTERSGYLPLPDGADVVSCGEHKDYGCLTYAASPAELPLFLTSSPQLPPRRPLPRLSTGPPPHLSTLQHRQVDPRRPYSRMHRRQHRRDVGGLVRRALPSYPPPRRPPLPDVSRLHPVLL